MSFSKPWTFIVCHEQFFECVCMLFTNFFDQGRWGNNERNKSFEWPVSWLLLSNCILKNNVLSFPLEFLMTLIQMISPGIETSGLSNLSWHFHKKGKLNAREFSFIFPASKFWLLVFSINFHQSEDWFTVSYEGFWKVLYL